MVKSALDVLNVCAVLPKAQAQFCEVVDLPEANKPVGINILLSAAEGEIVQVGSVGHPKFSPWVFFAALVDGLFH